MYHQYNLTWQYEFASNWLAEAAYVGSLGRNLLVLQNIGTGNEQGGPGARVVNTSAIIAQRYIGSSRYDALQTKLEKRFVKEIYPLMAKMPKSGKPDPKLTAQLESIAKKYGFASFDDYNLVVDNISLVMAGVDSTSKKYVGHAAVAKAQIAEVQADKKMSAKDKKAALDDLNQAAKAPDPTIDNKGNIDLVVKNYDKLAPIMGGDQN